MKKVKILTITLAIILITMIAFLGIYIPKQNIMENKIKGYEYAMDLKGARTIRLTADKEKQTIIKDKDGKIITEQLKDEQIAEKGYIKEEEPYNKQENLTTENYQKTKEIIEKRLKGQGVENYIVKVDQDAGDILIEIPENKSTDSVVTTLGTIGKFEIIDSQTKEVLMNNSDIKKSNVMYGSNSAEGTSKGTVVYLNIEFTKDGAKKIEDISNNYKKIEKPQTEENKEQKEDTAQEKTITLQIDGEEIMTSSFDEPITTGKLQLSIGNGATDRSTLQNYIEQANDMATVLDTGNIPIKYNVEENKYVSSDITSQELNLVAYVITAIVIIAIIILIVKYKKIGVLGAFSYIGLGALLSLIIKYANVVLSIDGIFGITIILILNYIFVNKLLSKIKKVTADNETINSSLKETYKEFFIKIIPICIAVITFCFIKWESISSFGMVMFWGITLIAIYNIIVTNALLKIETNK